MITILLVEDNASMRRNLAQMLTLEGYRVVDCASGAHALQQAREQRPDLVLCDIMMPGMDGYEVLAQLRAQPATASVPFIFLTAKGDVPDIRMGMLLGADDYLPKPVERLDLLNAIRTRLTRHEQQRNAFVPRFESAAPLEKLGISPREADILLWMAQGKSNGEIGTILGISLGTVKKHANHIFEKLGAEGRTSAVLRALEALSGKS